MSNKKSNDDESALEVQELTKPFPRRKFLGIVAAGTSVVIASCQKFPWPHGGGGGKGEHGVDLGSGDIGILNYAYALEQLEAAFYTKVIQQPYSSISAMEKSYLKDIRDHEIAHREFLKKALSSSAIKDLEVDFSSINFNSRTSVLSTAKAFEDLGVTAYNGAGKLISNADYLTIAGKIVSVEARHAALIRDLISNNSFADMTAVDTNGLDGARTPGEVLSIADPYIKTRLDASHLPTS